MEEIYTDQIDDRKHTSLFKESIVLNIAMVVNGYIVTQLQDP